MRTTAGWLVRGGGGSALWLAMFEAWGQTAAGEPSAASSPRPILLTSAERLSDIEALLQVLSASAWHFTVTVLVLSGLIALLLEATTDFWLRWIAHGRALGRAMHVPVRHLARFGVDRTLLQLPSDELAAQLAAMAGSSSMKGNWSDVHFASLRMLLLDGFRPGSPDDSRGIGEDGLREAQALFLERQLDRLQARLRAAYRNLELVLALVVSAGIVVPALLSARTVSDQAGLVTLLVGVIVPLTAAMLAPLLRQVLRNLIRRV